MSLGLILIGVLALSLPADDLPRPDGKSADVSKPVKVFILMGQSNMLEQGNVTGDKDGSLEHAVQKESLYPFLIDDAGKWTTRHDVRNIAVMGSGGPGKTQFRINDWLTVSGKKIGVEQGIGHQLGNAIDEPVLILKSAIGNRSLGWDLLPPGSPSYEFKDPKDGKTYIYAAYGQGPARWEKGTTPKPSDWKAGCQYDGDIARAKEVLANIGKYYPGATKYEIVGFFWWQGDKDRYDAGHAAMYERNLTNLIASLRKDFNAPNAKFVCATLGQTDKDQPEGNEAFLLKAKFAISDIAKHPELKGAVATVYTHPLSMGSSSNAHYGNNAKTYMNVGLAMGEAMVKLLKGSN